METAEIRLPFFTATPHPPEPLSAAVCLAGSKWALHPSRFAARLAAAISSLDFSLVSCMITALALECLRIFLRAASKVLGFVASMAHNPQLLHPSSASVVVAEKGCLSLGLCFFFLALPPLLFRALLALVVLVVSAGSWPLVATFRSYSNAAFLSSMFRCLSSAF